MVEQNPNRVQLHHLAARQPSQERPTLVEFCSSRWCNFLGQNSERPAKCSTVPGFTKGHVSKLGGPPKDQHGEHHQQKKHIKQYQTRSKEQMTVFTRSKTTKTYKNTFLSFLFSCSVGFQHQHLGMPSHATTKTPEVPDITASMPALLSGPARMSATIPAT